MSFPVERRNSPRHPAVLNRAVIEIRSTGKLASFKATLVDISRTGALLRMPYKVSPNVIMHIRLEYPLKSDWIRGQVIRRTREGLVGIEFRRPCDRTFLWIATRGEDFHSRSRPWAGRDEPIEISNNIHTG